MPFVISLDDCPRRGQGACLAKHLIDGFGVFTPPVAIAPILFCEFPGLQLADLARLETSQLFLLADMDPKLEQYHPKVGQLAFEVVDLTISSLPFVFRAKTFDPLNHHPAIPASIKDGDLPFFRQPSPEAPHIVVSFVIALRRRDRMDYVASWIKSLSHALDVPPLASCVPTFINDDDRTLLNVDLIAQRMKGNLIGDKIPFVLFLSDGHVGINGF